MAKKLKINLQGNKVDATEQTFDAITEGWNEYKCQDGTTVRLKTVVTKIYRTDKKGDDGEPIFAVRSSNVMDVSFPEGEKEVH